MSAHEQTVRDRVKNAVHQRKQTENTLVVTDHEGRWLFEIYSPKDKTNVVWFPPD